MSEFKTENLYRETAWFYDLREYVSNFKDIDFFFDRAKKVGGPVLELGCGTGRITIPLAEAGYDVWGIDLSAEMLAVLNKKCETLAASIKKRLHIIHADMCNFNLNRKFPLLIIPLCSFQLLTDIEQQQSCLDCVKKHLATDGQFIITLRRPSSGLDASYVCDEEILRDEFVDPKTKRKIRMMIQRKSIDLRSQVCCHDQIFYFSQPDGSETRVVGTIRTAWFSENQMRDFLESNNFKIIEILGAALGNYDGKQIGKGPEMIFICQLKQ